MFWIESGKKASNRMQYCFLNVAVAKVGENVCAIRNDTNTAMRTHTYDQCPKQHCPIHNAPFSHVNTL